MRLPSEDVVVELAAESTQEVLDLDSRIETAGAAIEARFRRHPLAEVITSLLGTGFRLWAEFLAAVGDPALIGSVDQLAVRADLAPRHRDSDKRTGRIHTLQR